MATKHKIELITTFSSDISGLNQGLDKVQAKLKNLDLGDSMNSQLSKLVTNLSKEISSFEQRIGRGVSTKSDVTGLEKSLQKIQGYYAQLQNQVDKLDNKKLAKLLPDSTVKNIDKATKAFEKLKSAQEAAFKVGEKQAAKTNADNALDNIKKSKDSKKAIGLMQGRTAEKATEDFRAEIEKLKAQLKQEIAAAAQGSVKYNKNGTVSVKNTTDAAVSATQSQINAYENQIKILKDIVSAEQAVAKAEAELEAARSAPGSLTSEESIQALSELRKVLVDITGDQAYATLEITADTIEQVGKAVANLSDTEVSKLKQNLPTSELQEMNGVLNKTEIQVNDAANSFAEMTERANDIENLKRSLAGFFSVSGAIELVNRSAREAYAAVKELDAAMTETAVVTDFTVGDMWDQLPRYTETANELGVTTLGAYETMTLFYQQGLKTNEVFEIGTETMKMARIGGLDYADATDKMTAALRGFNMELNAISAQRISDVYSELAAITAADTEEISTAMTKTASIANSANMEFETTAAFLSQIIETTRESAETAGTAMKTVIARFQELKKDPSEIGEVEGEIVDANKIETALRSVGVALRDSSGQFRELDDVFLELASKWETLDTNTQRYIATIAAGSRQQSRFIAMMSDYDRTMQLVNAAYDSNGAAQRQYEKTLESLESKLARLDNAWKEFVLGITNSEVIKTGVDLLTKFLQGVNKLTEGAGGLTTTILRLGFVLGNLKVGKTLFYSLAPSLKEGEALGAGFGEKFIEGLRTEFAGNGDKIKAAFAKAFEFSPIDVPKLDTGESLLEQWFSTEDIAEYTELEERVRQFFSLNEEISKSGAANQVAFNNAKSLGIELDARKLLLSSEDLKATATQIAATITEDQAERERIKTQILANTTITKGIALKIGEKTASLLNIKAIKSETAALLAKKLTGDAANATAMAGLGIAMAGALVAAGLVVVIAKLVKYAKNNTLEAKMERAAEATEKAKEAAQSAQEAYSSLNDSLNGLKEGESTLETLVKGTDEWKEKVSELNNEVTKLVEQYPELKEFLAFDSETGRIVLTQEGQDAAKQKAESRLQNSQLAYLQASAYENRLQEQQKRAGISVGYTWEDEGGNTHDATRAISEQEANVLAQALAKNSGLFTGLDDGNDLAERIEKLGISLDGVDQSLLNQIATSDDTRTAVIDLITQMNINSNAIGVLTQAYNSSLLDQQTGYKNSKYQAYYDDLIVGMVKEGADKTGMSGSPLDIAAKQYQTQLALLKDLSTEELEKQLEEKLGGMYDALEVSWEQATNSFKFTYQDDNGDPQNFVWDKNETLKQLAIENTLFNLDYQDLDKQFANRLNELITKLINVDVEKTEAAAIAAQIVQAELASGTNKASAVELSGLTEKALYALIEAGDSYSSVARESILARRAAAQRSSRNYNANISEEEISNTLTAAELNERAFAAYAADINNELKKNNKELKDTEEFSRRIAEEKIREKTGLDKINEILSDNAAQLEDVDSIGYYDALSQLATAASDMLDEEVSVEFLKIKENLDLVKSAANGNAEAMITLKKKLAEKTFDTLADDAVDAQDQIKILHDFMETMNGYEMEVGAKFDDTQYIEAFNHLIRQTSIGASDLAKILSSLGFEVQTETITMLKRDPKTGDVMFNENGKPYLITETIFTGLVPKGELDTYVPPTTTSSSSGGSSDKEEPYENSFDKYYNKVEDLNEELRVRNKLEVEYNDLIKDTDASILDITNNLNAQIASLERQRELQEFLMDARRSQIQETMDEYSDLSKYAWYNFKDNTVEINWDKINKVKDTEKGDRIEEYVELLEGFQEQQDEALDALDEINDTIEELNERGKEQYLELEDRILDAVVAQYQEEIDALTALNDSINSANDQMLNALQNTLAKQRQDEENAKTEQELGEMQRRLDYLRQDTSGANALEIKQLEKQLAEAQDDYTDALIDQKISEIEEQNQQAAEQRERQISFAEAQLEAAQQTGALWEEVHALLLGAVSSDGKFIEGSVLEEVLKEGENWDGLSEQQKNDWAGELIKQINSGIAWLVRQEGDDSTQLGDDMKDKIGDEPSQPSPSTPSTPSKPSGGTDGNAPELKAGSEVMVKAGRKWFANSYGGGDFGYSSDQKAVKITHTNMRGSYPYHVATLSGGPLGWLRKKDIVGYKTGGLADFTGPAWLDGTRARPELILNQRDTQNFIQLKDVLSEVMKRGFDGSQNSEEVTFDIDINIEKVDSKEDIDMLLNELERRITSNARYRNVNALNLKR